MTDSLIPVVSGAGGRDGRVLRRNSYKSTGKWRTNDWRFFRIRLSISRDGSVGPVYSLPRSYKPTTAAIDFSR